MVQRWTKRSSVYKDLIISTIVDYDRERKEMYYVYKDLIISTIVDIMVLGALLGLSL